jgi:hypothetical protein
MVWFLSERSNYPGETVHSFVDLLFRGSGEIQTNGIIAPAIDIKREAGQDSDLIFYSLVKDPAG